VDGHAEEARAGHCSRTDKTVNDDIESLHLDGSGVPSAYVIASRSEHPFPGVVSWLTWVTVTVESARADDGARAANPPGAASNTAQHPSDRHPIAATVTRASRPRQDCALTPLISIPCLSRLL
jgi:hypothetical protein